MKAVVCGGGGFIGNALVTRLKQEGYYVRAIDLKKPDFSESKADSFIIADLTKRSGASYIEEPDEVYQMAAEMGGAEYIFTGENDAKILHDSACINLNVVQYCKQTGVNRVFFSSSACVYPQHIQDDPDNKGLKEKDAWPANPDSAYGLEKIFAEQLYESYSRNYGLNIRIARFHNIYGPYGTFDGPRAKAPAAIARKVAQALSGEHIEIFGDGRQTRSFCFIDDCIEGVRKLMQSDYTKPINIGSSQMVSINELAEMLIKISGKKLKLKHIEGPQGVRGRNSDNTLIKHILGYEPSKPLHIGLKDLYHFINRELHGVVS